METQVTVSASIDAVIKEMRKMDEVYTALSEVILQEFGTSQHQELLDKYLTDVVAARSSVSELMRVIIEAHLADTDYKEL